MTGPGRTPALIIVVLVPILLAACSAGTGPNSTPGPSESSSPTTPSPTSGGEGLVITVDDGGGTVSRWTLTCDPPGGDHPDPAAACRALERSGATALPPVPKDRMCTMIFGGPQTATITGTWRGQAIISSLSLVNGCEIARWKALAGLLPPAAA